MADVNITQVHLLNVPLENDYKITLYFDTPDEQTNYFLSRNRKSYTDFSYQRKNHVIRVPDHFDRVQNCNYVMYQNSAYSDKWFYAFIVDLQYVDDGRTDITIETDYMQTWMFDITIKPSFVEREHVKDDTIGRHTVPEGLETGDYTYNGDIYNEGSLTNCYLIVGATVDLVKREDGYPKIGGGIYNGVFSGYGYFAFDCSDIEKIVNLENNLAEAGVSESIVCMFLAPSSLIEVSASDEGYDANTGARYVTQTTLGSYFKDWSSTWDDLAGWVEKPLNKPTSINGYIPKNQKLFTFPYCYLRMDNNAGGSAIYQYEYFKGDTCNFKILYSLTPGGSLKIVPYNYKDIASNFAEGLNGGKYPICAWQSDVYTNWLTQNAVNVAMPIMGSLAGMVGGVAGLAFAGATGGLSAIASTALYAGSMATIGSGVAEIGSTLGEVYAKSFEPPQMRGNINAGDVTYSYKKLTFSAISMAIKHEYAYIIDEYFSMFGYKVNRLKTPHTNHRKHYWFTKTIDVNIDGDIPNADMQVIKNCYNKGITFWRNDSTFGNYRDSEGNLLDNPIL